MSVSFTPSQSHAILVCHLVHQARMFGRTCDELEDLKEVYSRHPVVLERIGRFGYENNEELDADVSRLIMNDVILVIRAYSRFRKEFEYYLNRRGGLRAVKQYHSLLIDTLAPFMPKL